LEETKTTCYFQYYVHEDDRPKPLSSFMSKIADAGKEPEHRRSKSSGRKPPLNWLPELLYFENDFFLVAAGLLILKNYSNGTLRFPFVVLFS